MSRGFKLGVSIFRYFASLYRVCLFLIVGRGILYSWSTYNFYKVVFLKVVKLSLFILQHN